MDALPDSARPLQVLAVCDATFDVAHASRHCRPPHRHDYHELIWTRTGVATHLLDGALLPIGPATITVIGRGQVHLWRRAANLSGVIVQFRDELLADLASTHHYMRGATVLGGRPQVVQVPPVGAAWAPEVRVAVDIFRLENGKIVEHWDVMQDEKSTVSGRPMFTKV